MPTTISYEIAYWLPPIGMDEWRWGYIGLSLLLWGQWTRFYC